MTKLKPAKDIVILSPIPPNDNSGFQSLSTNSENEVGVVVALGSGEAPVEMKEGDEVVYQKYVDNKVWVGTKQYNFVKFEHIVAVVEKE